MSESDYMKKRPPKDIFPLEKQMFILGELKEYILAHLPPHTKLYKKRLFGSLAKGTFGKYRGRWKGREYSDVDVLFVVDDDFVAPAGWKVHFIAKENDWIVYNVKEVPIKVGKEVVLVLVQYMIVKRSYAKTPLAVAEGEKWGVPLKRFFSKHKYITL